MKTREQIAAAVYGGGLDCVMQGGNALRGLASHLAVVVLGNETHDPGLWRARQWPDQTLHLDRFEDYLLRPAREGLGIPDLAWLWDVLEAHPDRTEREEAFRAVTHELPDFRERAEAQKRKRVVRDVRAAGKPGGNGQNQYTKGNSNVGISDVPNDTRKRSNKDPERIISRLKRDAADNSQAADLLAQIEAGAIKPYKAARAMGWVKTPDPTTAINKQREKLEPEQQVAVWRDWGLSLPEVADRVEVAKAALDNLTDAELAEVLEWAAHRIEPAKEAV